MIPSVRVVGSSAQLSQSEAIGLIQTPSPCSYQFMLPSKSYTVYFLASTVGSRTYVGYSVHPFHRLRQHNGELVGGAKSTRVGRPYRIVCMVSGFPDESSALQFEWAWHRLRRPSRGKRKPKWPRITGCHEALARLFSIQWSSRSPPPYSFPLTLLWMASPSQQYSEPVWICQPQPEIHPAWIVYTGYYHPGLPQAILKPPIELEIKPSSEVEIELEIEEEGQEIELTIIPSS